MAAANLYSIPQLNDRVNLPLEKLEGQLLKVGLNCTEPKNNDCLLFKLAGSGEEIVTGEK